MSVVGLEGMYCDGFSLQQVPQVRLRIMEIGEFPAPAAHFPYCA